MLMVIVRLSKGKLWAMSTADHRMREYYDRGAQGLKRIYEDFPISVHTRETLDDLTRRVAGKDVLEIAGGTGFFARVVSEVARSLVVTDVAAGMLAEARAALADRPHVSVREADAYGLAAVPGVYGGAFALHWFSHVPYERHAEFLSGVNRKVAFDGVFFSLITSSCRPTSLTGATARTIPSRVGRSRMVRPTRS